MDTQVLEHIADTSSLPGGEGYRLSPQQNRLWSLQQVGNGATFRAQCVLLIEGQLDAAILRQRSKPWSGIIQFFARPFVTCLRQRFRCK